MAVTYLSKILFENNIKVIDVHRSTGVCYSTLSSYGTGKISVREADAIVIYNYLESLGIKSDYDLLVENKTEQRERRSIFQKKPKINKLAKRTEAAKEYLGKIGVKVIKEKSKKSKK